jgi:hypothetical protein
MRKQEILFPTNKSLCVFPKARPHLAEALLELGLEGHRPVIVLIGGYIPDANLEVTKQAIETIAAYTEENKVLMICGATIVGIMGLIGQTRLAHGYQFPLLGITLNNLASWPKDSRSSLCLWWKKERWSLSCGYSHFILIPGERFGDDSPWIVDAASWLSRDNRSVTILANGGGVARKDINLSLTNNRPVVVLAGTGRLADELAGHPGDLSMMTVVRADDTNEIVDAIQKHLQNETIAAGRC